MDVMVALAFVCCTGIAIFVGMHKDDISQGRVPEPVEAYWSE